MTAENSARPFGHPERKSRDPAEVTFKLTQRDPSTSLGMTEIG
jgi:hypothetical protein